MAEDGQPLSAWWLPGHPEAPVVLFFHGNAGCLGFPPVRLRRLATIRRAGASVLALDYRGYGQSPGSPSEPGLYADGEAAYREALRRAKDPGRLVIHGRSLGGAVACHIASQHPCAGLVLESTFTSIPDVFSHHLGRWVAERVRHRFANRERLRGVELPLLVMHGTADRLVPVWMGRELFRGAAGRRSLWLVRGAGHNGLLRHGYREVMEAFLASVTGSAPARV